ncbi:MAG: hypothetical protein WC346_02990 [Methanogenium sp.]|jgi:hypothetical protein
MPLYDFRCSKCPQRDIDVLLKADELSTHVRTCSVCGAQMIALFPTALHTKIDSTIDSRDRGKVVTEKNKKLKKRHAGYEHEEQNLRKKITKQVNEKIAKESRK